MPKNSSEFLTNNYGLITDYIAEAFHYQFAHTNRYEEVTRRIKLGQNVEGRDEKGIKKTVSAFLKILHPDGPPTDAEFEEYVAYAVEGRRRVKEQMNKRKPDDEFARINLTYFASDGKEVVVYCPESKNAIATQHPFRRTLKSQFESGGQSQQKPVTRVEPVAAPPPPETEPVVEPQPQAVESHYTIFYGDTGHDYESIFVPYLQGAKSIEIDDAYIRLTHQIQNFVRLCETIVKYSNIKQISLITGYEDEAQKQEVDEKLGDLKQSLLEVDVIFDYDFNNVFHDREIRLDNGWYIKIGRGLDFYQKPLSWFDIGSNDLSLRKCLETKVDIFRIETE